MGPGRGEGKKRGGGNSREGQARAVGTSEEGACVYIHNMTAGKRGDGRVGGGGGGRAASYSLLLLLI